MGIEGFKVKLGLLEKVACLEAFFVVDRREWKRDIQNGGRETRLRKTKRNLTSLISPQETFVT